MTANSKVTPQAAQQLLHSIKQDLELGLRLKNLLNEEKACLEQRQFVAHQTLVKQKTQLLMAVENADKERRAALTEMGFNTDKAGFEAFLTQVPPSWQQQFRSVWEQLADTMNCCARVNNVNGKILAHAQSSMERLMMAIRGANSNINTYQSNGRKTLAGNYRMLATA